MRQSVTSQTANILSSVISKLSVHNTGFQYFIVHGLNPENKEYFLF